MGLCDLPYDSHHILQWFQDQSCLKFDGYDKTGKRVIVRDCGVFEADESTEDEQYLNTEARGSLCHCMSEECNSATTITSSLTTLGAVALSTAFYFNNYIH